DIYWTGEEQYVLNGGWYIFPEKVDNIWEQMGRRGGSSIMKQIFSITKGKKRNIFLMDVMKVTLYFEGNNLARQSDLIDLLQRLFKSTNQPHDDGEPTKLAEQLFKQQYKPISHTTGRTFLSEFSTGYRNFEIIRNMNQIITDGRFASTHIRSSFVNLTLLRTDEIPSEPMPFNPCPEKLFMNLAKGGKVFGNDCTTSAVTRIPHKDVRFLGEVDTKLVFI